LTPQVLSDFCNQSKRYLASLLCTSQTTYITKRKINSSKKKSGQNIVQDSLIVSSFFKKTHTHKQGKIGAEHTRIRERERESVCVCVCVFRRCRLIGLDLRAPLHRLTLLRNHSATLLHICQATPFARKQASERYMNISA
jgi:hypothetical protein